MADNEKMTIPEFRIGDLVFVRGDSWLSSRLIRFITKSDFTHVGMIESPGFIFETNVFQKLGVHPFEHTDYAVYRFQDELTIEQQEKIRELLQHMPLQSKGYDWMRLVSLGLEILIKKPFGFDDVYRYICSEAIDILYEEIDIDLVPGTFIGQVSPKSLIESPYLQKIFDSKEFLDK